MAIFFILLLPSVFAERGDTLSLYNQLSKVSPVDQISIMLKISMAQRVSHPGRSFYWANRALLQSQRLSVGELSAESYFTMGYLHYTSNNFDPALDNFKKAERIYNRLGLAAGESRCSIGLEMCSS